MKRWIIIIGIFVLSALGLSICDKAEGSSTAIGSGSITITPNIACATPDNGDELDEGFIGTGYEGSWTEVIGSGGTADEDFSLSGLPISNSCSEGLQIDADQYRVYSYWNKGSTIATSQSIDIYAEVYITSRTWQNWALKRIIVWDNDTLAWNTTMPAAIYIKNRNGIYRMGGVGDGWSTETEFPLNTWLKLKLHIESGTALSYFQCTGCTNEAQLPFTYNDVAGQYLMVGLLSNSEDAGDLFNMEVGYVYVNTP